MVEDKADCLTTAVLGIRDISPKGKFQKTSLYFSKCSLKAHYIKEIRGKQVLFNY